MRDNSSDERWATLVVDWPVYRLDLDVEVIEPRPLTALEWVLLRVVEEFQPTPPSLAEVAEELGLDRPEFLQDTLREVLRLRALAPHDPEAPVLDLDVAFTDTGRELFRRGQIESEPATHRISAYVDALTDEDLPAPDAAPSSGLPFFAGPEPPPTRDSIGLDRVRTVMRRFHREILRGDAVVRAHKVRNAADMHRSIELVFTIASDGMLAVDGPRLSARARELIRSSDLPTLGLVPRTAVSGVWDVPWPRRAVSALEFSAWQAVTVRTLPAQTAAPEACAAIRRARREIVLHALWLAADGVRAALDAARARGVHVAIAGGDPHLEVAQQGTRLSVAVAAATGRTLPGALIVDASEGLRVDDVLLRWQEVPIPCELAGAVTGSVAADARRVLVDDVLTALPSDPPLEANAGPATLNALLRDRFVAAQIARLVFLPQEKLVSAVQQALAARTEGLERLEVLRDLSVLARDLAPDIPAAAWEAGWRACWHQTFAALRSLAVLPVAQLQRLLAAAPPALAAEHFVDAAVGAWAPAEAPPGPAQRSALRELQTLAARRWGRDAVTRSPAWTDARDRNLVPVGLTGPSLRALADDAAALLQPREAATWARAVLETLPRPRSASEFAAWLTSAQAVRLLAGAEWDDIALGAWREATTDPSGLAAALPNALALLPVEPLARGLLAGDPPPTRVLELRRLFAAARRDTATAPFWADALRRALPPLAATYRATEHASLVRTLAQGVSAWPQGQAVLTEWAGGLADGMRHAADLPALVFWLAELAGLAPGLARDVQPRASAAVHEHIRAVRDARARALPLWSRLVDAWRALGLSPEHLERLAQTVAAKPKAASPQTAKQAPKKERRR